ncbi:hypothetical protein [Vibrio sp. HA2012]|uniref:hypothetical protein n=1 Tax=Vibrio sp. HA2012 TaxID=1971595 RepID=UPI0018E201E6|nr:hypothetical protein [Vibrio sp. HA2012]
MPDLYCEVCKKVTPHKSVMRRSPEVEQVSLTQKLARITNSLFSGKNHYKLEQQHFCRYCNCQTVTSSERGKKPTNKETALMVKGEPEQVGA